MIKLSIHLITYNNGAFIKETLESILNQKVNFDYEIVVGDDCSTDNTYNILTEYTEKYPTIFKLHKNNSQLGILKNFKATLDRCSGKYVFDIAGDDMLKSNNTIQKMVALLDSDPSLGFVDSGYDILHNKTKKTEYFVNKKWLVLNDKQYRENVLLGNIVPIGICFKKEALYKYMDFETYIGMNLSFEDYPILVDVIMHTSFKKINESLHIYRVHDDSYSHSKNLKKQLFAINEMKLTFNFFSNKYAFSKSIINQYEINHHKHLLFLAGYFEDKQLGKDSLKRIKQKTLRDWIHFWASQCGLFRKLISLRKKII